MEGMIERKDGMKSCDVGTYHVGVGVGWVADWVRDTDANEAEPLSGSVDGTGVVSGGVSSVVNHMGWYRLRARVTKRRWIVYCCVCGDQIIFHTMCGALITGIERST